MQKSQLCFQCQPLHQEHVLILLWLQMHCHVQYDDGSKQQQWQSGWCRLNRQIDSTQFHQKIGSYLRAFTQVIQFTSNHYSFPQFMAPKWMYFIHQSVVLQVADQIARVSKNITRFIKGSISQNYENYIQYCPLSGVAMTSFGSAQSTLLLNSCSTQRTPSPSRLAKHQ